MKDQTGLTISPSFSDTFSDTFSYEMKIGVEREMMEKIRKLKMFHETVSGSSWSVVGRRIRRGELKSIQLAFTHSDWRAVVRSVRLGQERNVIRAKLASILSQLEQEEVNTASISSAKQEVAELISQLTSVEDQTDKRV